MNYEEYTGPISSNIEMVFYDVYTDHIVFSFGLSILRN